MELPIGGSTIHLPINNALMVGCGKAVSGISITLEASIGAVEGDVSIRCTHMASPIKCSLVEEGSSYGVHTVLVVVIDHCLLGATKSIGHIMATLDK